MDEACVMAEMNPAFPSAAKEQDFRCRARILKVRKRLVYGVAERTGVTQTAQSPHARLDPAARK
jgi:hypothetical protein